MECVSSDGFGAERRYFVWRTAKDELRLAGVDLSISLTYLEG